ncbi:MAG: hypothetical protein GWN00_23765 [Aliifodinibius sp.]|nr:hypothetical protein [Fodinibius sp.]NIY27711.1 hypothetical protein [Fodinibius sp.]
MEVRFKNLAGMKWVISLFCLFTLVLILLPGDGLSQGGTYEIQVKDLLKVSFWEYPELNSQVRVDKDGKIDLPIIGRVTAAGLTINVLREKIISQMSQYNKVITQLSIDVLEYGGNVVHITGQVAKPGKYSFEEISNLWEILLEAGGPLETANLDQVVIVRKKEDGKLYTVDVTESLRNANLSDLPEVYPGDTIQVPGTTATGTATSPLVKQDVVYIFGAIARPGPLRLQADSNLLDVIGRAGGPRSNANLNKVKHISVSHGTASVVEVNLNDYFEKSFPVPMPVGPGDTIIVPQESSLGGRLVTTVLTTTLTAIATSAIFIGIRSL